MSRLPYEPATATRRMPTRSQRRMCVVCEAQPAAELRHRCRTCQDRKWRAKHPEHHLWNNLKKSAKRRGLDFTLPLWWWLSWCEMTGFAEMVGRTKGCASIDRIRSWEGYHANNIQILEVGANSAKGQRPPPINSEDNSNPF